MRLMVFSAIPTDATSFYRCWGPLGALQKLGKIDLIEREFCNWKELKSVDAVFMQRPYTVGHADIAQMAKNNNVPLIVDFDDDVFNIPMSNPVFWESMTSDSYKDAVKRCVNLATVVIVSTEALAVVLRARGARDVRVIPNAWDETLSMLPREPFNGNKKVLWRGSATHDEDLESVGEGLYIALSSQLDTEMRFVGRPSWRVLSRLFNDKMNVKVTSSLDIIRMLKLFSELKSEIMIVPLMDSGFNRCKSNCAWIEGTMTGSAVIAKDLPEFCLPGVINYTHPAEFGGTLLHLLRNPSEAEEAWSKSYEYITSHLLLSRVNELRLEILEGVSGVGH